MKKSIIFLVIAASVFACGQSGNAGETARASASGAVDGEKIYKQYCITCHGLYGDMGASGAANLAQSTLSLEERIQVITNGRLAMNGFKTLLNEEKIKAVAEYSLKLKGEE